MLRSNAVRQSVPGFLSLSILPVRAAQRLHLIPAAPPPLSDDEWHLVKERSAHRRDFQRPCAICKEELGIRSQVNAIPVLLDGKTDCGNGLKFKLTPFKPNTCNKS